MFKGISNRKSQEKKIFFEGDSIMANIQNANLPGGFYLSTTAYNTIISTPKIVSGFHLAKSGQKIQDANIEWSTRVQPYLKYNDIYVQQRGVNDFRTGATANDLYGYLTTNINNVHALGGKFIACTIACSDFSGDSDFETERLAYNILLRANSAGADAICDIGGDSVFNSKAATANSTYYVDKLHLATAGQNLAASYISTATLTLL